MVHGEYLGGNPLIGRKVWLVRHIIGDKYGDPWDWSVVIVKPHFFARTAVVKGAMNLGSYSAHQSLQLFVADMGFRWAEACRSNGVLKRYRLPDTRRREATGTITAITSEAR